MEIFYVTHNGQKIDLMRGNYKIEESSLFSHAWDYDSKEKTSGYGGTIEKFRRDIENNDLKIHIEGAGSISYKQAFDFLMDLFDLDVIENEAGKLWIDDRYIQCFITEGSPDYFVPGLDMATYSFKTVSPYPFWIRETSYSFLPESGDPVTILPGEEEPETEITLEKGIMFPGPPFDLTVRESKKVKGMFDLPCDLKRVQGTRMINNESYLPCHFKMTIYGPVTDPEVVIANHLYKVETTVFTGERLEIDSRTHSVKKIGRLGEETDLYNSRYKLQSAFEKIPPGRQTVTWPGGYGIDITLFDERSEPRWSL